MTWSRDNQPLCVCQLQLPQLQAMGVAQEHCEQILENVHVLRQSLIAGTGSVKASDPPPLKSSFDPTVNPASTALRSVAMNANMNRGAMNHYPDEMHQQQHAAAAAAYEQAQRMVSMGYHPPPIRDSNNPGMMPMSLNVSGYASQTSTYGNPAMQHQQPQQQPPQQQHMMIGQQNCYSSQGGFPGQGQKLMSQPFNHPGSGYFPHGPGPSSVSGSQPGPPHCYSSGTGGGASGGGKMYSTRSGYGQVPVHHHLKNAPPQNPQEIANSILQMAASSYPNQTTVQVPLSRHSHRPAPYHIPSCSPVYGMQTQKQSQHQQGMVSGELQQMGHFIYPCSSPHHPQQSRMSPISPVSMPMQSPHSHHSGQSLPTSSPSSLHSPAHGDMRSPVSEGGMMGMRSPPGYGQSISSPHGSGAHMKSPVPISQQLHVSVLSNVSSHSSSHGYGEDIGSPIHSHPQNSSHFSPGMPPMNSPSGRFSNVSSPYTPGSKSSIHSPTHSQSFISTLSTSQYLNEASQRDTMAPNLKQTNPLQSLKKLCMLPETQVIDPKSVVNDACVPSPQSNEYSKNCDSNADLQNSGYGCLRSKCESASKSNPIDSGCKDGKHCVQEKAKNSYKQLVSPQSVNRSPTVSNSDLMHKDHLTSDVTAKESSFDKNDNAGRGSESKNNPQKSDKNVERESVGKHQSKKSNKPEINLAKNASSINPKDNSSNPLTNGAISKDVFPSRKTKLLRATQMLNQDDIKLATWNNENVDHGSKSDKQTSAVDTEKDTSSAAKLEDCNQSSTTNSENGNHSGINSGNGDVALIADSQNGNDTLMTKSLPVNKYEEISANSGLENKVIKIDTYGYTPKGEENCINTSGTKMQDHFDSSHEKSSDITCASPSENSSTVLSNPYFSDITDSDDDVRLIVRKDNHATYSKFDHDSLTSSSRFRNHSTGSFSDELDASDMEFEQRDHIGCDDLDSQVNIFTSDKSDNSVDCTIIEEHLVESKDPAPVVNVFSPTKLASPHWKKTKIINLNTIASETNCVTAVTTFGDDPNGNSFLDKKNVVLTKKDYFGKLKQALSGDDDDGDDDNKCSSSEPSNQAQKMGKKKVSGRKANRCQNIQKVLFNDDNAQSSQNPRSAQKVNKKKAISRKKESSEKAEEVLFGENCRKSKSNQAQNVGKKKAAVRKNEHFQRTKGLSDCNKKTSSPFTPLEKVDKMKSSLRKKDTLYKMEEVFDDSDEELSLLSIPAEDVKNTTPAEDVKNMTVALNKNSDRVETVLSDEDNIKMSQPSTPVQTVSIKKASLRRMQNSDKMERAFTEDDNNKRSRHFSVMPQVDNIKNGNLILRLNRRKRKAAWSKYEDSAYFKGDFIFDEEEERSQELKKKPRKSASSSGDVPGNLLARNGPDDSISIADGTNKSARNAKKGRKSKSCAKIQIKGDDSDNGLDAKEETNSKGDQTVPIVGDLKEQDNPFQHGKILKTYSANEKHVKQTSDICLDNSRDEDEDVKEVIIPKSVTATVSETAKEKSTVIKLEKFEDKKIEMSVRSMCASSNGPTDTNNANVNNTSGSYNQNNSDENKNLDMSGLEGSCDAEKSKVLNMESSPKFEDHHDVFQLEEDTESVINLPSMLLDNNASSDNISGKKLDKKERKNKNKLNNRGITKHTLRKISKKKPGRPKKPVFEDEDDNIHQESMKSLNLSKTMGLMSSKKKNTNKSDLSLGSASLKRKGPYIHLEGDKDHPTACIVINQPLEDYSDLKGNKRKFTSAPVPSIQLSNIPSNRSVFLPGNQLQEEVNWKCVLCGKHSSFKFLGDLFGPYTLESQIEKFDSHKISPCKSPIGSHGKRRTSGSADDLSDKRKIQSKLGSPGPSGKSSGLTMEVWVHEDCLVWSDGVFLVGRKIYGLEEAFRVANQTVCTHCRENGAMVGCLHKGCSQKFHYACAVEKECYLDEENFSLLCPKHKEKKLKALATASDIR
ncbi:hypothetical protein CHS0354_019048 [Potamilus streckersoni]|uniref:PHD-type domain-containing protein n=1 Tax=Potamilus streckersoni TaxID=2493646 RepID=A0AAE0SIY9_9BIVA|nr:hypothetical protein CHS0354_019048 [Potamilus streckersoni]